MYTIADIVRRPCDKKGIRWHCNCPSKYGLPSNCCYGAPWWHERCCGTANLTVLDNPNTTHSFLSSGSTTAMIEKQISLTWSIAIVTMTYFIFYKVRAVLKHANLINIELICDKVLRYKYMLLIYCSVVFFH